MEAFKSVFASKAVWAGILTILAATPVTAKYLVGTDIGPLAETLSSVATQVLALFTVIFRVTATKQLVSSPAVADVANQKVAMGIRPKEALVVAKANIAAAENDRTIG